MPIQPRHPIAMAQQALSNQAICEGRFTLGLGPSHVPFGRDRSERIESRRRTEDLLAKLAPELA